MPKHLAHLISGLIAATAVTVEDTGGVDAWMKVLPAGTFTLRDGRGPFVTGGAASMQAIVERTRHHAGATELMIDYDHQGHFAAVPGVGGTAKAAGWVKQLDVRADGIWARVEWTEAASTAIRAREYRYLSPLFASDKSGRVTLLANIGLVNMPAMDLDAIAARFATSKQEEPMEEIAKMLGLAGDASKEDILAAIRKMTDGAGKAMTAAGLKTDAGADKLTEWVTAMVAERTKIAEAIGCKADARQEDIVVAARQMAEGAKDAGKPDPSKYVPIEDFRSMRDDFAGLKAKIDGEDAERAVDEAIRGGRLIPAQRQWGQELFAANRKAFDEFVSSAPVLTTAQRGDGKKDAGDPKLDEHDLVVARQLGLTDEQMIASKKTETV